MTPRIVLPDTSLVRSFDTIGRLDLVEMFCEGLERSWAYDVEVECENQHLDCTRLRAVFGTSVKATPAQAVSARAMRVQFFQSAIGASTAQAILKDMGECTTLTIWADRAPRDGVLLFLTEDRQVVRFCRYACVPGTAQASFMAGRVPVAVTSEDLVQSLVKRVRSFTSADASAVQKAIIDAGRPYIGRAKLVEFS
ncbi:hypothetical protein [Acidipropionibacterium timonense]|uniref:hypothetical protein n=1 Tax=Acidipropionibacterium timonense TaxID=2161818 RepID=UPI0014367243|nr:hypothetical protein [Acidipropionibacterium timonense]